jgi:Fe-S oxidoreductase
MELSEKLVESFESARVRKIVSCCPHCTTMLDKDYRQIPSYARLALKVVHHSELLAELLPRLPLKPSPVAVTRHDQSPGPVNQLCAAPKPSPVMATYHDPCHLARGRGITSAPRQILRRVGLSIGEAAPHGQNTRCCGAGGAQLFVADDQRAQGQKRVNQLRFAELMESKATAIAVACPYCPIMLRDAANNAKRDDVEILDLAEIVARSLQA